MDRAQADTVTAQGPQVTSPWLVLNVDDNDAGRYTSSQVLRRAGFRVEEARTGQEALRLASASRPDLVLLDMRLPDIPGTEVCRRLKAEPESSGIPILQISATYRNSEHWAAALEMGADAYLTHPVEPVVLVATVRALLRARTAEAQLRNSARLWRATFDAMAHGVCLIDRDGRIVRVNAKVAALRGKHPRDLIGFEAIPPLPGAERPEGGWAFERTRESHRRETVEVGVGDQWFEISTDPLFDESGAFDGAVRTIIEVTDRKRAEAERAELLERERKARRDAEAANRVKDEFLATLSHELRTPLNAIVGWAGVLRAEGVDKATAARAIETIERNAHLQSRLIEDILDVSRIVTGQFKLELEPVDVAAVVLGAVESVRPLAKAKSIALEVAIAPDLGRVVGEAARLQQVVWNLLTNAVKFAGPSGQVTVRLARRDGRAEIRVADDGQGIDPAFLPHVFDAFRQADASTSRRHGGLGLGLAIVRYLVELHGGTCEAESEGLGRGATFTVTLPLQPASPTAEPCGEPPNVASQPAARLDGVRVLLVDDEPDAIDLAATILRAHGAEVLAAASTEEALRIFEQHRPAVVVSDLGMPGRDGFDLLRSIRSLPEAAGAYVPALALSAYARPEERETAIRAGFDEHVAKPFGSADLVAAVSRIAAASSAH